MCEAKPRKTETTPAPCSSDRADVKVEISDKGDWRIHESSEIQHRPPERPVD